MYPNNQSVAQSNTGESIVINHIKALVVSMLLGSLGGVIIWVLRPILINLPSLLNGIILILFGVGLVNVLKKYLANKTMSFKWLYYLLNIISYLFVLWVTLSLFVLFINFIFNFPGAKLPF